MSKVHFKFQFGTMHNVMESELFVKNSTSGIISYDSPFRANFLKIFIDFESFPFN